MQTIIREDQNVRTSAHLWSNDDSGLRQYISDSIDRFAAEDYQVYVSSDLSMWVNHMQNAPEIATINPAYDPRYSTFGPDEAFWIGIEQEDQIVGTCCNRLFVTEDHVRDDIASQKLWGDKFPPKRPLKLLLPDDMPHFSGKVVHEGGAWLHPQHRGRGLAERLIFLARVVSIRNWDPLVFTGACAEKLFAKGVSRTHYKIPHDALLLDGWCPPVQADLRMHFTWIWTEEVLGEIVAEPRRERTRA